MKYIVTGNEMVINNLKMYFKVSEIDFNSCIVDTNDLSELEKRLSNDCSIVPFKMTNQFRRGTRSSMIAC